MLFLGPPLLLPLPLGALSNQTVAEGKPPMPGLLAVSEYQMAVLSQDMVLEPAWCVQRWPGVWATAHFIGVQSATCEMIVGHRRGTRAGASTPTWSVGLQHQFALPAKPCSEGLASPPGGEAS